MLKKRCWWPKDETGNSSKFDSRSSSSTAIESEFLRGSSSFSELSYISSSVLVWDVVEDSGFSSISSLVPLKSKESQSLSVACTEEKSSLRFELSVDVWE